MFGAFAPMARAISFSMIVLPTRGGAMIKPRCPWPSGAIRSMARAVTDTEVEHESVLVALDARNYSPQTVATAAKLAGPRRRGPTT